MNINKEIFRHCEEIQQKKMNKCSLNTIDKMEKSETYFESHFVRKINCRFAGYRDPDVHQVGRDVREGQVADEHFAGVSHTGQSNLKLRLG